MASVSDTLAVGKVFAVGPTQIAAVQALRGSGQTDAKIASLISEGGGILEATAASLTEPARSAPAPLRASPNSKVVTTDQQEKLFSLFQYYVSSGDSEKDATAKVKALFDGGAHADGTLDATLQSIREVDPEYIMERAVAARTEPGGLFNVGNTCWLNSTLQAFFKEGGPYYDALVAISESHDMDTMQFTVRAQNLLRIIYLSEDDVSKRTNIKLYDQITAFVDDLYRESAGVLTRKGHQEDASEGLQALINYLGLYEVTSKQSPVTFSELRHGLNSGTENITQERTPLPSLKQKDRFNPATSVKALLAQSHRCTEKLTGDEGCTFGRSAGEREDTLKVSYLSVGETPPKVGDTFPISAPRFRTELDNAGLNSSHKDLTPIQFDPEITLPLYDAEGTRTEYIVTLQLQSIVCHNGSSAQSGHYVTYTRNADGTYTEYNDSQVFKELSLKGIASVVSMEGYLATYKVTEVKRPTQGESEDSVISIVINHSRADVDSGQGSPDASPPPSATAGSSRGASPALSTVDGIDSTTLAQLTSLGYIPAYLNAIAGPMTREQFQDFVEKALLLADSEDEFFDTVSE